MIMNQNSHYRTTLPHQLPHLQCPPVQSFTGRFPGPNPLDALSPMIPPLPPSDAQYHAHLQPFINNTRPADQLQKTLDQQKPSNDRNFHQGNERANQENYKPTTSSPNSDNQFNPHCNHGSKNCIQCYNKPQQPATQTTSRSGKVVVDAATMTDPDEIDQMAWQNVSGSNNTKVAEYLTSLRQFLKIERRFVCGVCGAGLKRKEHLDRHQLSHSEERPYSCAACPKTFKRNEHLTRHYVVHTGEKAQKYVCGDCGAGHERKEHLERHRDKHSDARPHLCAVCGKSFKRTEHLQRHLVIHTGHKPHACLHCGKAFYRRDHLLKHYHAHRPTSRKGSLHVSLV